VLGAGRAGIRRLLWSRRVRVRDESWQNFSNSCGYGAGLNFAGADKKFPPVQNSSPSAVVILSLELRRFAILAQISEIWPRFKLVMSLACCLSFGIFLC